MHSGKVLAGCKAQVFYLRFTGDVRLPWCVTLEDYCSYVLQNKEVDALLVDLSGAANLDSTTLGILAKIGQAALQKLGSKAEIYLHDSSIQRLLQSMGFDALFSMHLEAPPSAPDLPVLPLGDCDEDEIKESVIDAHRTLMDMNQRNTRKFQDLVETLERTRDGDLPIKPIK